MDSFHSPTFFLLLFQKRITLTFQKRDKIQNLIRSLIATVSVEHNNAVSIASKWIRPKAMLQKQKITKFLFVRGSKMQK